MPSRTHSALAGALAVVVCLAAPMAGAQETPTAAAKARLAKFRELGGAFKRLNDEVRKGRPDGAVVTAMADKVAAQSATLTTWFPAGSGPSPRIETRAKASIWTKGAEFNSLARASSVEAQSLAAMARRGDMGAVQAQAKRLGQACAACHDTFREEQ